MSPLRRHVSLRFASGDITYLGVTFRHVTLPVGRHLYNVLLIIVQCFLYQKEAKHR